MNDRYKRYSWESEARWIPWAVFATWLLLMIGLAAFWIGVGVFAFQLLDKL